MKSPVTPAKRIVITIVIEFGINIGNRKTTAKSLKIKEPSL